MLIVPDVQYCFVLRPVKINVHCTNFICAGVRPQRPMANWISRRHPLTGSPNDSQLASGIVLRDRRQTCIGQTPRYFNLGVTNNADAEITPIELDPREPFLLDNHPSYRVIYPQSPPSRVVVHIEAADEAGLHMPGLPRGVIGCGSLERQFYFSVVGRSERTFTIRWTQLPRFAGSLTSVYRAQSPRFANVGL